ISVRAVAIEPHASTTAREESSIQCPESRDSTGNAGFWAPDPETRTPTLVTLDCDFGALFGGLLFRALAKLRRPARVAVSPGRVSLDQSGHLPGRASTSAQQLLAGPLSHPRATPHGLIHHWSRLAPA